MGHWIRKRETEETLGKLAFKKLEELKVSVAASMGFALQAFVGFMNEEELGGLIQKMLLSTMRCSFLILEKPASAKAAA